MNIRVGPRSTAQRYDNSTCFDFQAGAAALQWKGCRNLRRQGEANRQENGKQCAASNATERQREACIGKANIITNQRIRRNKGTEQCGNIAQKTGVNLDKT